MSISNVLDSFDPIVRLRNYAPTRTFVTKWDVEIDRNRVKKINRGRDRSAKYFDYFDLPEDYYPVNAPETAPKTRVCFKELCDDPISFDTYYYDTNYESDDGDGEETNQKWLRSVHAENAFYERKYPQLSNQPIEITRKRFVHFEDDQSLFKRVRNELS